METTPRTGQLPADTLVYAREETTGAGTVVVETSQDEFDKGFHARHTGFTPGWNVMQEVNDDGISVDEENLRSFGKALLEQPESAVLATDSPTVAYSPQAYTFMPNLFPMKQLLRICAWCCSDHDRTFAIRHERPVCRALGEVKVRG
jgi:hypothetical protein